MRTRLMRLRGISTTDMARRCGPAVATVSGACRGRWIPDAFLVALFAEELGMPEDDLLAIAGLGPRP